MTRKEPHTMDDNHDARNQAVVRAAARGLFGNIGGADTSTSTGNSTSADTDFVPHSSTPPGVNLLGTSLAVMPGSSGIDTADVLNTPLEPLPFGEVFSSRELVYQGRFIDWLLPAVEAMPDVYGTATRMRVDEFEGYSLNDIAESLGISKSGVVTLIDRGARKGLTPEAVMACELLHHLVQWHRLRRREGCTLAFLEHQYLWLRGVTTRPNLVEYAIQVGSRGSGVGKMSLLTLEDGATYITSATSVSYRQTLLQVHQMVRQCAFMHLSRDVIEECVFSQLDKLGFRDLSASMLNEAFEGLIFEYDSDAPKVLAVGNSCESHVLAVLLQSPSPMSISQIRETIHAKYGMVYPPFRISKVGKDMLLCFSAGVFGIERHFEMPEAIRYRVRRAAVAVLLEHGMGRPLHDALLLQRVNARLQVALTTPEGTFEPLGSVTRHDMRLALRAQPGIDCVGARDYQLTPVGEESLSTYLLRLKAVDWITKNNKPLSLEILRKLAPEMERMRNGYALYCDDVLIRIGHGIFWLRDLPLPDGVLFNLSAHGIQLAPKSSVLGDGQEFPSQNPSSNPPNPVP